MSWIDTYDATFFLAVGSIVLSALTISIKYCLKSKCEHFTLFWGLVKIDRRVDLETQIDLQEIEEQKIGDENEKKEKENE
jgi:hypothetical protein